MPGSDTWSTLERMPSSDRNRECVNRSSCGDTSNAIFVRLGDGPRFRMMLMSPSRLTNSTRSFSRSSGTRPITPV